MQNVNKYPEHYLKIIVNTAHSQKVDEQQSLAAGADIHIIKPITINELYQKIALL